MGIAAFVFVAVVALVFGTYWVVIGRPEDTAQKNLRRRLKSATGQQRERASKLLQNATQLSTIPALDVMLKQSRTVTGTIQRLLDQAGVRLTVGTFVLLSACCGAAAYLVVSLLTGLFLVPLAVAVLAAWTPYLVVKHKATKRMNRFEELFPEAIGLIVRALRAGHAFTTGLAMVAEEMDEPVGPEFRLLYDHQNFGMPLEQALKALAERVPLLDVRFFVTAILTQRDAGGNLAEILENIAAVIRDRFKVKRQVRVITAHARFSGLVLVCLPPACALVLMGISPEHMRILVTDPLGIRMMIIAITMQIIGGLAIKKIVNIEY